MFCVDKFLALNRTRVQADKLCNSLLLIWTNRWSSSFLDMNPKNCKCLLNEDAKHF